MRRLGVLIAFAVACGGTPPTEQVRPLPQPSGPKARAKSVTVGKLDPRRPFALWFARGGGTRGLQVVYVPEQGAVEVDRDRVVDDVVIAERAAVSLTQVQREDLSELVSLMGFDRLDDVYSDAKTNDGAQWILRIRQGRYDRSVHFDNRFPHVARRFAHDFDALLAYDLPHATFQPAPNEAEAREDELWATVE